MHFWRESACSFFDDTSTSLEMSKKYYMCTDKKDQKEHKDSELFADAANGNKVHSFFYIILWKKKKRLAEKYIWENLLEFFFPVRSYNWICNTGLDIDKCLSGKKKVCALQTEGLFHSVLTSFIVYSDMWAFLPLFCNLYQHFFFFFFIKPAEIP